MMRRRHFSRRLALIGSLAALSLIASTSPAAASITIGQVADPNAGNCDAGTEFLQLGLASGNPYVVPGNGTITSWTVQAGESSGELTMKVFRASADPGSFRVVGHAGPQRLTPGGTAGNTFPANVRVRPGDLLGLHNVTATPCGFKDPAGRLATFSGDLADSEAAGFAPDTGFDLDIQAVFVPDNSFSVGGITRDKKKGTASLTVNVPNTGELALSGNGVRAAGATGALGAISVSAAGEVKLLIKATGKKRRKLNKTGQLEVTPRITFTPTGGDPSTQSRKLKLRKL
jgi:hypothetical protein